MEEVTKEKLELVLRNQVGIMTPLQQGAFSIEYLLSLSDEGLQDIWLGQRTILANLEKEMIPILRECDLTRGRCELIRLLVAHRAEIGAAGGRRVQNVTPVEGRSKIQMPSPAEIGPFELWPRYHTTANAAKMAGIDRDTLHRWLKKGAIVAPRTRRGTRFFWTDAEINRLKHDIEWMRRVTKPFLGTAKPKELAPSKLKVGQPLKSYNNRQLERAKAQIAAEIERHAPPKAQEQPETPLSDSVSIPAGRLVQRKEACAILGLDYYLLGGWLHKGLFELPSGPTVAGRELWSPEDIERLREFAKTRASRRQGGSNE